MLSSRFNSVLFTSGGTKELLSPSALRVAVLISADFNLFYISHDNIVLSTDIGFPIQAASTPLLFSLRDYGDLVQKQWIVQTSKTGRVGIVEVMAKTDKDVDDYLSQAPLRDSDKRWLDECINKAVKRMVAGLHRE